MSRTTLATIERVLSVEPIEGADSIEKITVLGWELVAKKGEFTPGSLCVYAQVDSILPPRPEFAFLEAVKYRIKTRRMRGQISQGIAFPLTVLFQTPQAISNNIADKMEVLKSGRLVINVEGQEPITVSLEEGTDVTEILGIVKYDPPEEDTGLEVGGKPGKSATKGNFPSFISKTDETRIQAVPSVLRDSVGEVLFATEKLDGSSMTVFLIPDEKLTDGTYRFGVCSRNQEKKELDTCHFWALARRLDLESKMRRHVEENPAFYPAGICLQGELVGPGVQKNKLKLKEHDFYCFNVYNVGTREFLSYSDFVGACETMGVQTVPVIYDNLQIDENTTVHTLVDLATRKSVVCPTAEAEGLVFRTKTESKHRKLGRFSFKAINPLFCLKNDC